MSLLWDSETNKIDLTIYRLSAWVVYRSCRLELSSGIRSGQANFYSAELSAD